MLTKFGLTRKSKKNTVLKAVIILGVGEAHTFTCVTCVTDWSRASCFPCAGISWVTCCSSSSTRPLVKQLVLKDLCIPVPSTSQRLQERRSGEFISRAREQCTVHRITKVSLWRKKNCTRTIESRIGVFFFLQWTPKPTQKGKQWELSEMIAWKCVKCGHHFYFLGVKSEVVFTSHNENQTLEDYSV